MKTERGNDAQTQHMPQDVNPKANHAVNRKGYKLAAHEVENSSQAPDRFNSPLDKKLLERIITSIDDPGYESDTRSTYSEDEFSDTASTTSSSSLDSGFGEDEAFIVDYCESAQRFINEDFFDDESYIEEPLFWTEAMVQELKTMATKENRRITFEDYQQLNQAKNQSLDLDSHERSVDKLFSQMSLFELPIYHSADIQDRLDQINHHIFDPKSVQHKALTLPKRILFSQGKEEKLFQYCLDHGKTSITLDDYLEFDHQYKPDAMTDRQTAVRPIKKETLEKKLKKLSQNLDSTRAANAFKKSERNRKLEKGLLAGAVTSGAGVAAASALQPPHDPSMFDHISPKDVPIDQIKIFAAHNTEAVPGKGSLPLLATNQNMDLEDMLDKTPIRGFDLDLHEHRGEIVINHGGIFDSTVSNDSIPKLDNVLETMNNWLGEPGNHDEVLFLNFENRGNLPLGSLESAFGRDAVLDSHEYSNMFSRLGRAPTIEEIRAEGFKVVDFNHNRFIEAGTGETGFRDMPLESIWEDRTIMEHGIDMDLEFGKFSTDDIAPHITTDQIDEIMNSPGGKWISLDQVSPNDPRFFKPEDRDSLTLKPDLKLMGLFYESEEAFQSALLGFGTATAGATAALALAGGAYQGFLNEKKIRNQDKLMPSHLKAMELTAILQKRKKSKKYAGKPLGAAITVEEVKSLYKKNVTIQHPAKAHCCNFEPL